MSIRIEAASKAFDGSPVFTELSLAFEDNRVTVLLGPSGCGKTTLLNILSGVIRADSGSISGLNGRRISYLFQEPRLLPWRTVRANLDFVLKDKLEESVRAEEIERYLEVVGLREYADYYPDALSGGMRQRAAIARAFAFPAELLLADEPFQALDLSRKISLVSAFETLWREDRRTALFVTHDIHEALLLGDDIFVLSARPATVVAALHNEIPHGERSLRDDRSLALERELYGLFGINL